MSSAGGEPIELGISSSSCLTVSKRRKVQSLWIKARYVDWEWAKLGKEDAHLKVSRAWEADFWSRMRWQTWFCDGVEEDDDDDEREYVWKLRKHLILTGFRMVEESVEYGNALQCFGIYSALSTLHFPSPKVTKAFSVMHVNFQGYHSHSSTNSAMGNGANFMRKRKNIKLRKCLCNLLITNKLSDTTYLLLIIIIFSFG